MRENAQRWVFGSVAVSYAALVLSLLPWASQPGFDTPYLIAIYGIAICAADLCTVLFLVRQYRIDGHPYLLPLAAAYLFGACMSLPVALTFPDAFGEGHLLGHDTSSTILYLSWRVGSAVLLLLAVLLGVKDRNATRKSVRPLLMTAVLAGTILVAAAFFVAALNLHMTPLTDGRFNLSSLVSGWLVVALSLVAVVLIFTTRSHQRPMFGWLALMLTATVAEMTLSTLSGARYSLGWYVSRCSTVIASYLLLAYLAAEFARDIRDRPAAARKYSYVGAVALAVGAVLLRYFLLPWAPTGLTYTTAFGAVAIAVWMGGWGPGVVTAVLGAVLSHLFVKSAFAEFSFGGAPDALGLVLYSGSCSLIIALGHKMRAARVRFQKSQEAAIQGYSMLRALRDENGRIIDFIVDYVNPRGAALARQTPEAVTGRRVTEVLPGVVSAGVFSSFCNVTETGEPLETEVRYEQGGRVGWFRNMVVKIEDGVAISFFDITYAKRLERELAQRAHQLERADTNKGQFLATLSHELRNPLAPLRNALAIMRKRGDPDSAGLLDMMDRQLGQLVRHVDDLLDVSRIDRGKIALKRERVKIDAVVSSAIETARPAIEAKGHELVVRFAPRSVRVDGDAVRLAQVVSNLLINAAKFTPQGGRIELALHVGDRDVEISIRDNGIGIEAEDLPRIFEMFVQLEQKKERSGGLGLGLALVKSLVELHDGRVEARSAGTGQGAEFVVRLPISEADADATMPRVKPRTLSGSGRRILVVDDNEDSAQTLGALLTAQGHDVRVFFAAAPALESAIESMPDIAFLDITMPGMDGVELARRLRAISGGRELLLIAITGLGRTTDIERTRAAGFDAHLTKPADPERILALASAEIDSHTVLLPFPRSRARD